VRRFLTSVALAALALIVLPDTLHAWTPGTHIFLSEAVLANLQYLPLAVADLLRAFPFDFLYGSIAADTSIAKKYAPVGRHCHAWHVGQEIYDLAHDDRLRSFGLGYLAHLAADVVAHNFFVPRQLVRTAAATALGHSYWESRFEMHLGDTFARTAREVILLDHSLNDAHLDRIISPTIFSVGTNRRIFRGMVRLTDSTSWQRTFQLMAERSRWDLSTGDIEAHMALAFDWVMDTLAGEQDVARRYDPSGDAALRRAKGLRRQTAGRRPEARRRPREEPDTVFTLPAATLPFWERALVHRPWELGASSGNGGALKPARRRRGRARPT